MLTALNDIYTQLGAELIAHTMTAVLAGARIFTGAELLSIDEVYSAERLVIDYKVVQYVKNVLEGFKFPKNIYLLI